MLTPLVSIIGSGWDAQPPISIERVTYAAQKECLIGAGALITSGKTIPLRSMVYGSPAKVVRELEEQEIKQMKKNTAMYIQLKDSY